MKITCRYMIQLLMLISLVFSSFTIAQVAVDNVASDELRKILKLTTSFEAKFEQKVFDEKRKLLQVNHGTFHMQRPNRFRWQVTKPFDELLIADGVNLWTIDFELEQASVQNMDASMGKTPAMLLSSDDENILSSLKVMKFPSPKDIKKFKLFSKVSNSIFESVVLSFQHSRLVKLELMDNLGQLNHVEFVNIKSNHKIPDSLFQFIPPKGMDVISSHAQ